MNIWLMEDGNWELFVDCKKDELTKRGITIGSGATIGDGARIGSGATIGDGATIGEEALIGDGALIGKRAKIGEWARIGDRARIGEWAKIGEWARIGDRVRINSQFDCCIITNLGSRNAPMTAYKHKGTVWIGTGCWVGDIKDFEMAVKEKHGSTEIGNKYLIALKFVREYFS